MDAIFGIEEYVFQRMHEALLQLCVTAGSPIPPVCYRLSLMAGIVEIDERDVVALDGWVADKLTFLELQHLYDARIGPNVIAFLRVW